MSTASGGCPGPRARFSEIVGPVMYGRDLPEIGEVRIESSSGDVVGIEAKSAATANTSDRRGLRLLRDKLGPRFKAGIVIYSGEHTLPLGDRIWAVPVLGLWQ